MRFKDVTTETGTGDRRWATGLSHSDLDQDGGQDIVIANDYGFNFFYFNRGERALPIGSRNLKRISLVTECA